MTESTVVYLPVEISRRELMSRAFLACRLASAGHDVFVFASDFFDRFGWPAAGVYIGKNVFRSYVPHDTTQLKNMKAAGIQVWYHDEEAGILPGDGPDDWEFHLQRRTDASELSEEDAVLVWGDFQNNYFIRQDLKAPVFITGSINFELYRSEYADLFCEYDSRETRGMEGYVLFNTRFATANAFYLGSGHVINSSLHTEFVSNEERYDSLSLDGILLYHFIGLISELALQKPELPIVVRPHPMENHDFYCEVFRLLPNVTVTGEGDAGSWIRRSRCLVQNGCTTGVQANIAEKPVITFVPADTVSSRACSPLPNELGAIVKNRGEAKEAILSLSFPQETGRWPMSISNLNTIETIESLVRNRGRPSAVSERSLSRIVMRSRLDDPLRRMAYQIFRNKLRQAQMRDRWLDRSFFARFPEMVHIANRKWTQPLRIEACSRDCWRVRPAA